jgi:hypothetical protein
MKRSLSLLGRIGTVIIFVSIAILLSSGIGPIAINGSSSSGTIPANSFNILQGPLFTPYPISTSLQNLTPQNKVEISLNATSSVNAYLMEGNRSVLENWIRANHPEQPINSSQSPKTAVLGEFIQANPSLILWQGQGENIRLDYMPSQIMNLTVIVSNQNGGSVNIKYSVNVDYGFASISRMRSVAIWILPIGLLCALPWATLKIMQRRNREPSL